MTHTNNFVCCLEEQCYFTSTLGDYTLSLFLNLIYDKHLQLQNSRIKQSITSDKISIASRSMTGDDIGHIRTQR